MNSKTNWIGRSLVVAGLILCAGLSSAWQPDNGDGTYTNPILYADYSDPDITRVGSDFYMVSSSFVTSPGLVVLKSKDMVNWEFVGHAASPVGTSDAYNMVNGQTAYEGGFWAPSIRHHNGVFYIAVQPTFDNGRIYYASDPAGPWSYHQLDRGIYDPGLFFDDDGTGYILSGHGPQSLMVLDATYSSVAEQYDNHVDSGGEGTHLVKRGSWYYAFNANPGVWPFQLRCSRTQDLVNGPWETGQVCLTATSGGHQGAIVDINDSDEWFGFVHQDSGGIGRMPRIGPVFWENDWPVFGTPTDRDNMGSTYPKPVAGQPVVVPATSDDFNGATLGLQWQWNHNPDNTKWSLTERPGWLRLRPGQADRLWSTRNTLTQKAQGPASHGIVRLDLSGLQPGDVAGFGTFGKVTATIAVTVNPGGAKTLGMTMRKDDVGEYVAAAGVPIAGNTLYLRTDFDFTKDLGICSYSEDGTNWTKLGGVFQLVFGFGSTWQGQQMALFCYNTETATSAGCLDVDSFTFAEGADFVSTQRGRPVLNAARTTFVGDNGQLLRGPYESTEWTTAAPQGEVARIKDLGCNTVHLYAEVFDLHYPAVNPETGQVHPPGYAEAEIDKFVQMTRDLGLYLVITIGNGGNNGNHNPQWAVDFWNHYAPRYANESHVVYEIHNEPVAWGPSYLTATTPAGALDMEVACYNAIRSHAPDTPVLLFTYAVLGGDGGRDAALTDIAEFNQRVFGNPDAVWTNEAVGFHGYAGWKGTSEAVAGLLAAGYPCMMTEFIGVDWASGEGQDIELTSELERMGVSWNTFLTIPPYGVSPDVTRDEHFKGLVNRAGLSWTPDFGNWPVARGVFGNGGQPRMTTTDWSGDFLTGTLRIEAEDFDTGGQGVAYNDSGINSGGQYRPDELVDISGTGDVGGGYKVGWTEPGEWMEYTVWVAEPGLYDFSVRTASPYGNCSVRAVCNDRDVTGEMLLPNTGGFETWATTGKEVFLEFGRQKIRFETINGGFDLNWIELAPSTTGPIADGTYKLVNRHSGLAMDGAGAEVVQSAYNGSDTQHWLLEHVGAGNYRISNVADGDRWTNGGLPGDKLGQVWWWGADAAWQRFLFRPANGGFQRVITANFGREIHPEDGSPEAGSFIVNNGLDGYDGSPTQQWAVQDYSAPEIPVGLTAVYGSLGGINLAWNAVATATSYTVWRSTVSGGGYTSIANGVSGTNFADTAVLAGVDYYYVVTAIVGGEESQYSGEASAPRLRARLRFDEDAGTLAADSTGNGWDGTLAGGALWAEGFGGNSVTLDGTDDHVTLPAGAVNGLDDCSIACWVNLDSRSTWARIFDFGIDTGTYMFLAPKVGDDNTPRLVIRVPGLEQAVQGDTPIPLGEWAHVAVVFREGTVTLYLNGDPIGSNVHMSLAPSSLGHTTANYLGKSQYFDPYLDGRIDDFRIYASALSSADVVKLMELTTEPPAPTGLVVTPASGLHLTWNVVAEATSYQVMRSTVPGGPYDVLAAGVTGTEYTDSVANPGTTYFYVVVAINGGGASSPSDEVSGLSSPPPAAFHYPLDDMTGFVTEDSFGSGWSAILEDGTTWVTGYSGGAADFDGIDDHLAFPTGLMSSMSDFTFAAWVRADTVSTWSRIIDIGTGTDSYLFLTPQAGGTGNLRFAIRTPSVGEEVIDGDVPLPTGGWQHVAVTLSGSVGTLYLNGVSIGTNDSMTLTPADLGWTNRNYLGKSQWPDPHFDGRMDEVRIDSRAWSAQEIGMLADTPRAHLAFSDGSGSTAWDLTGHGWDGVLVNGPAWTSGSLNPGAVDLDGADDYVGLPDGVVDDLEELTLTAWIHLDADSVWSRIFDFGTGTDNYMFLATNAWGSESVRFVIRTPSVGEQVIDGSEPLATGTWTHVAVALGGGGGTLYVNGVAVGTNSAMTLTPADLGVTDRNYLGKSQFADPHLDGRIDDFRIYGRALDGASISALASQTPAPMSLTAVPGNMQVDLSWSEVTGASGYRVARATFPTGPYAIVADGAAASSLTNVGLTNGSTYYFRVSAIVGNTAGDFSGWTAVTPAQPPVDEWELLAPSVKGSADEICVSTRGSVEGRWYQLQTSEMLNDDWGDVGNPVEGNGDALEFLIPVDPEDLSRFFRIRIASP